MTARRSQMEWRRQLSMAAETLSGITPSAALNKPVSCIEECAEATRFLLIAYIKRQFSEEPDAADLGGLLKLAKGAGLQDVPLMEEQLQVVADAVSDAANSTRQDVLVPAALRACLAGMTVHTIFARETETSVLGFKNREDLERAMRSFNGQ